MVLVLVVGSVWGVEAWQPETLDVRLLWKGKPDGREVLRLTDVGEMKTSDLMVYARELKPYDPGVEPGCVTASSFAAPPPAT